MGAYLLKRSKDPRYWLCTDAGNNITCRFEDGKFTETQEYFILDEEYWNKVPERLAFVKKEMEDFLREDYHSIAFPPPKGSCDPELEELKRQADFFSQKMKENPDDTDAKAKYDDVQKKVNKWIHENLE